MARAKSANTSEQHSFNEARQKIGGVFPEAYVEPLPPQPSILPGPPEPVLVTLARRINARTYRLGRFRRVLRVLLLRQLLTRLYNHPALSVREIHFKEVTQPRVSIIIPVYNKFSLTMQCLKGLEQHLPDSIATEVIVVDNGSHDGSRHLKDVRGLHYVRNQKNEGFVGGCNIGATVANGEMLVFLNNDASVTKGWLEQLVDTLERYPQAGLVGSKIVYPDGRLQEAGGIIYRDGSGCNYGRNDHPDRYQYNYVREVDYCSGASIIIRRELFESFGGFDSLYAPAYYEDTDLAFKVRDAGLKVVYQPLSVIYHIEGATSGTSTSSGFKKYQEINKEKFLTRWHHTLQTRHFKPHQEFIARDRSHKKCALVIDELVPTPDQDAGSVRMFRLLTILQKLDYKVTFLPVSTEYNDYVKRLQAMGIEVVYGPHDTAHFLKENGKFFDLVMLSRPRVGAFFLDMCQAFCSKAKIIYDTVDLHYLRLQRQAEFEQDKPMQRYLKDMALTHEVIEKHLMREVDTTLVVSSAEKTLLEEDGIHNVAVVSNIHELVPTAYQRGYDDRTDLLFVGGFQHLPNIDSIQWLVSDIFPTIKSAIPAIQLHVVGSKLPDALRRTLEKIDGVVVHGFVSDDVLHDLLQKSRLFVAPLRFGAGVKGKIGQSIEYGLPVVTTTIGAEGMYMQDGVNAFVADTARQFAARTIAAYNDKTTWHTVQESARTILEEHFSYEAAQRALKTIL